MNKHKWQKYKLGRKILKIARTPYYELPWYYRIIVEPLVRLIRLVTESVNEVAGWLDE